MWGDVLCMGSGGQKSSSGVQGRSPGRGPGGWSPPEAEAISDFDMHNFDRILNYLFCTCYRNTADALSKGKIQRKCQNLGDIIHWRPPLQIMGGRVPPVLPRFTPLPLHLSWFSNFLLTQTTRKATFSELEKWRAPRPLSPPILKYVNAA